MATTALERLRELRQEDAAKDKDAAHGGPEEAGPLPSTSCPAGRIGSAEAPEWDQAAADVLDILARADGPMPHPGIVKALAGRGHEKAAAQAAIAGCQGRGWIWHNLTTGYELPGEGEEETR